MLVLEQVRAAIGVENQADLDPQRMLAHQPESSIQKNADLLTLL